MLNIMCMKYYFALNDKADVEQLTTCNSSVSDSVAEFRGSCIGTPDFFNLTLNIEQASAKLPSDFGFVEGGTSFLTSEF